MTTTPASGIASCLLAALLVTGCGSIGDILGGSGDPYPGGGTTAGDLRGTVERVDTGDRIIWVESEDDRYNLRDQGDVVALYYDDRTVVEYQGRSYRPADLERGDRIAAEVDENGGRLYVDQIEVLSDISAGSGTRDDRYATSVRGVVREVDTADRTLTLEQAEYRQGFTTGTGGDVIVVSYDADTVVDYQGQRYAPGNLERGDLVEITVRDLGGRLLAEEIEVVADVRDRASRY
jgi:hypothetical protein